MLNNTQIIGWSLSLGTNFTGTCLIAWIAWYVAHLTFPFQVFNQGPSSCCRKYRKFVKENYGRANGRTRIEKVFAVLVESGFLYCLTQVCTSFLLIWVRILIDLFGWAVECCRLMVHPPPTQLRMGERRFRICSRSTSRTSPLLSLPAPFPVLPSVSSSLLPPLLHLLCSFARTPRVSHLFWSPFPLFPSPRPSLPSPLLHPLLFPLPLISHSHLPLLHFQGIYPTIVIILAAHQRTLKDDAGLNNTPRNNSAVGIESHMSFVVPPTATTATATATATGTGAQPRTSFIQLRLGGVGEEDSGKGKVSGTGTGIGMDTGTGSRTSDSVEEDRSKKSVV